MTRDIRKSALAEEDLIGIWLHGAERWNAAHADRSLDELENGIRRLRENPELGLKRSRVRSGYRVLHVNRHAIYYKFTPTAIRIVRVLHERMDPANHL